LSCMSITFCMAGNSRGDTFEFNGNRWANRYQVFGLQAIVESVSCASTQFCIALDAAGLVSYFNGHVWSLPLKVLAGPSIANVDCPNTAECLVAGDYSAFRAWHRV
jgi:hypothetical protein